MVGACPICRRIPVAPNCWVRFHVRYGGILTEGRPLSGRSGDTEVTVPSLRKGPIVILACKYCNFAEWGARTGGYLTHRARIRVPAVCSYLSKFDIRL